MSARATGLDRPRATAFDGVPVVLAAVVGGALGLLVALLPPGRLEALALLAPFVVAAVVDARTRRIPNALSAAALALALTAALATGEGASSAVGALLALLAGLLVHLAARGGFGLGDVKLMAGVGAAVGVAHVLDFLVAMAVGSSRVDLQACKLEYSIVSPK